MQARTWALIEPNVVNSAWLSCGTYDRALPVAGFDFDGTLAPYRGKGPAVAVTTAALARLSESFNLVVFSNSGDSRSFTSGDIGRYVAALDRVTRGRVTVYCACGQTRYRKPCTGAWEHYRSLFRVGALSFFCGDAGGEEDFSRADFMFALNVGAPYVSARAMFGGPGVPFAEGLAPPEHPIALDDAAFDARDAAIAEVIQAAKPPFMVIMVGPPGSGKSRVATELIKAARPPVDLVSMDLQHSHYHTFYQRALDAGHSIVLDNTNIGVDKRTNAARRAREVGYSVVVCYVATPRRVCEHLNTARVQLGGRGVLPITMKSMWKMFVEPSLDEPAVTQYGATLITVPFACEADAPPEITKFYY